MLQTSSRVLCVALWWCAWLLPAAVAVHAQGIAGTLDPGFQATPTTLNAGVTAVFPQPDGGALAGGSEVFADASNRTRLARFRADGSEDADYDGTGDASTLSRQLLGVFPDGDALALAALRDDRGFISRALLRLDGRGRPRPGFDAGDLNLSLAFGGINYLIQPDGKILVGGQVGPVGGPFVQRLLRLNPDGSPDAGFQSSLAPDRASPLALQADGKILFYKAKQPKRVNPDGSRDRSFRPAAGISYYTRGVLAVQGPEGKIIVGRRSPLPDNSSFTEYGLARLNGDGSLDPGFTYSPVGEDLPMPDRFAPLRQLVVQPDGKLVLAVRTLPIEGDNTLLRLLPDGVRDLTFSPGVDVPNINGVFTFSSGEIAALALQPADGRLLVGGRTSFSSFIPGTPSTITRAGFLSRLLADPAPPRADVVIRFDGLNGASYPPGVPVTRYPIRASLLLLNQGNAPLEGATITAYVSDRTDYGADASPRRPFRPADDPSLVPLLTVPQPVPANIVPPRFVSVIIAVKLRYDPANRIPAPQPLPRLAPGEYAQVSVRWNISLDAAPALAGKSLVFVVTPPAGAVEVSDANNVAEFHPLP